MGDDGTFFGKAFNMVRLFLQIAERDEQGEIGILVAGLLDHAVQYLLNVLPKTVSPWFDDHTTPHGRALGQICRLYNLLIPFGIVFFTSWRNRGLGLPRHFVLLLKVYRLYPGSTCHDKGLALCEKSAEANHPRLFLYY